MIDGEEIHPHIIVPGEVPGLVIMTVDYPFGAALLLIVPIINIIFGLKRSIAEVFVFLEEASLFIKLEGGLIEMVLTGFFEKAPDKRSEVLPAMKYAFSPLISVGVVPGDR
jgi:hypothetical protein